jgi:hypothetical protein
MFDRGNGCPNRPAQVVVGVLVLKEVFDLTDDGALEQLEFNLQWQHALRLRPEEAHLCQKTLHNFRARLLKHDGGRSAFVATTGRVIEALGTRVDRQRLDSTHILSNFAILTRLGLFCETLRVALVALRREHPKLFAKVKAGLRERYLRGDETRTGYRDAKSDEGRRRLDVCARDVYRVLAICQGKFAANLEEIQLLQRLFDEQCVVVPNQKTSVESDDDDAGDGDAPVALKEPKTISSGSLQTPHDPDVTYSGHKGKGYEVQIAETCHEENDVEIITHVAVTPSCEGDANAAIPAIEDLAKRGLQPQELVADTHYGSAENAVEAAKLGTELVSPLAGTAAESSCEEFTGRPFSAGDFAVDPRLESPARCPAGHESTSQQFVPNQANTVALTFDAAKCASCPLAERCPARTDANAADAFVWIKLERANIEQRRRAEERGELRPRYRIRAGIEATNSELKRRHGLGKLSVRGEERVTLAVYLKAIACNLKRMLQSLLSRSQPARALG